MFERFTERARQCIVLGQDEARLMKHVYIGTEHLLLGLIREEEGLAAKTLNDLGVTIEDARAYVGRVIGHGTEAVAGQIPFTPRAKRCCELALREALGLGHNYIGTEHILLGIVRENEGVAVRYLQDHGLTPDVVHETLLRMLRGTKRFRVVQPFEEQWIEAPNADAALAKASTSWPHTLEIGMALYVFDASAKRVVIGLKEDNS